MKKKIIIVLVSIIVLGGVFAGGYFFANSKKPKEEPVPKEKTEEKVEEIFDKEVTDSNYITTMKKVSKAVFYENIEYESRSFDEVDNLAKINITNSLIKEYSSLDETTGKELTDTLHKYFGSNQSMKFENIKCKDEGLHEDPEEKYIYIYDSKEGKYIHNPKHGGHGTSRRGEFSVFDNEEDPYKINYNFKAFTNENNDKYVFEVKMMFYDNNMGGDIGPLIIKNAYKSYSDITNKKPIDTIGENKEYETIDANGIPHYDLNKVYKNNLDKLDTYVFEFEKENDNLIFTKYYKKA